VPRPGCNSGFREGLRDLRWIEGRTVHIEERYGEFKPELLHELAADLVKIAPDVIWTHSPPTVRAAMRTTTTIPIVIGVASDLVEQGTVASLSRPGANITGMELRDLEIMGKRLDLLKEMVPAVARVAVLVDPNNSAHAHVPGNIDAEGRALKVQFQRVEVRSVNDFDRAVAAIRADALLIPEAAMFSQNRGRIIEPALKRRLPIAAGGRQFAESGSLFSYGANIFETCRRSAVFVDKILRGTKPADLPVERPSRFEFVINLKIAKLLNLKIPQSVLFRADKVIK
jgi:putative ABC transport system substrate-binding protein